MTLYRSAVLTRTRILLDHADVTPVVTALVTGMPLPVPVDTLDTSNPHYLAFDTISDQWFLRGRARFPVLDQNRITADNDMMGAALLVAGAPDMYLDFDGADTHAAAVVWRADRRMQFVANEAMYFGRGFADGVFFTSTKAAPVDVDDGSQPSVAEGADLAAADRRLHHLRWHRLRRLCSADDNRDHDHHAGPLTAAHAVWPVCRNLDKGTCCRLRCRRGGPGCYGCCVLSSQT